MNDALRAKIVRYSIMGLALIGSAEALQATFTPQGIASKIGVFGAASILTAGSLWCAMVRSGLYTKHKK
jgi:hypothetical protein